MNLRIFFISFCTLCCTTWLGAQQKFTISGYITDSQTGESLIGAVAMDGQGAGAAANTFGYYSLTIPQGKVRILYSYIGYSDVIREFYLGKDTLINVSLEQSLTLEAASVTGRSAARTEAGIASSYLGSVDVPIRQIQSTPVIFGEADVLKALQKIPGVQSGTEGFTGLHVRGGGPDENLILLDGTPIYNVDHHMLGIFSVFQTEAVKRVSLYKGSFPARYGGRVSSIVDIRTNDGNLKAHSGSVTVGVLNSRAHVEGPIVKDRLSYSLSARGLHTFYVIPLLRLFGADVNANYFFYDLNGKLTWRHSDGDRFYLGVYSGADRITQNDSDEDIPAGHSGYSRDDVSTRWGNDVAHIRWNHVFHGRLFSNTTVAFNRYRMNLASKSTDLNRQQDGTLRKDTYDVSYISGIRDWSMRTDFDWHPSPQQIIRFGAEYMYHTFKPESLSTIETYAIGSSPSETKRYDFHDRDSYHGHEASVYGEVEYSLPWNLTLDPGLRASLFNVEGRSYFCLQPRVNLKYDVQGVEDLSVKAGYSRMAQYVHLLSSLQISMPTDLWVPITKDIPPVTSDQVSAGVYYSGMKGWEFSVEGYLKRSRNLLEYSDGVVMIGSSDKWEERVETGKGRSVGVEFFAQKTSGDLTGWLSYTLAKSERRFENGNINLGRWFPYKYDRRHNININLSYKLSEVTDFNFAWTYASGTPVTIPERKTVIAGPREHDGEETVDYVPSRNNYRLPSSHHLDISLAFHRQKGRGMRTWTVGVYNVYNRRNPNFYYLTDYTDDAAEIHRFRLKTVTVLPIVPSVSYTRTF